MKSYQVTKMFGELRDDVNKQIIDLIAKMNRECIKKRHKMKESRQCTLRMPNLPKI